MVSMCAIATGSQPVPHSNCVPDWTRSVDYYRKTRVDRDSPSVSGSRQVREQRIAEDYNSRYENMRPWRYAIAYYERRGGDQVL